MFATDTWIIERACVHRSTVARWRARRSFPPTLQRLAELELDGRLELIHDAWRGWRLDPRTGELVTPGGERYRAGEILVLPIRAQLVRELERRLHERERTPPTLAARALQALRRLIKRSG